MSLDDHDLGEIVDLVNETSPEEAEEIIAIADDHGVDLEQAKEIKDLAEELDIDVDDAAEINESL